MPQPHIITPIELEGLSEAGKLAFVRDAYDRNKKSLWVALMLLFIFGGFGVHRFYLQKRMTAWLWPLFYFPISFGVLFSKLDPLWSILIVLAVIVEAALMPRNVELYNTGLNAQLKSEISASR